MRDDTIPVPGAADRAVAYGDLTDDLLRTDWWTDAMLAPRRHPRGRHPVRVHRRRHRLLRHRRLPAHLRRAHLGDPGAHPARHALGELRVPHPRLPDPARRAAAQRLGVVPGQHLGLPELRPARGDGGAVAASRWRTCSGRGAALRPTTGRPRRGRRSSRWSRSTTGSATRRWWSRARSGWCAGGSAAATSRSSPRPRAPARTKRVAFRSRFVHVAVGYPGLKFLPDLMDYRETHRDFGSVVNAYEPHEQIYERLHARAGHRARARRRHRRVARVAAADRRPRRAAGC